MNRQGSVLSPQPSVLSLWRSETLISLLYAEEKKGTLAVAAEFGALSTPHGSTARQYPIQIQPAYLEIKFVFAPTPLNPLSDQL